MMKNGLVWFRSDLRLHDHAALLKALGNCTNVYLCYFGENPVTIKKEALSINGLPPHHRRFILESLIDLASSVQSFGGTFNYIEGSALNQLPSICKKYHIQTVYAFHGHAPYEVKEEQALEDALAKLGVGLELSWGNTLFDPNQLPFNIRHIPDVFTSFRKKVESECIPLAPVETPSSLIQCLLIEESRSIPHPPTIKPDIRMGPTMHGGEREGLRRIVYYFFESERVLTYKDTRNELLGNDFSSRFSAYLAIGALSPRMVYHQLKRFENHIEANESTYWLYFELLWREYFYFLAARHQARFFQASGYSNFSDAVLGAYLSSDTLLSWIHGQTGQPFIDACMRELWHTGYLSNRGRQVVASFFINELKGHWLQGAAYFESVLIDYDPILTYGNWAYLAGLGADPRGKRTFNIVKQSQQYDPKGEYIKTWVPELEVMPSNLVHEVYVYSDDIWKHYGLEPGHSYPRPTYPFYLKTA
jgi:deoxyribodipyrimidine photo-lyase